MVRLKQDTNRPIMGSAQLGVEAFNLVYLLALP
jgi:hypothetical protein